MNASQLSRKLLYYGYDDVTDYLKNSPLNRYIYKQILALRTKYSELPSILTVFNEMYYQCVRIHGDRNPGQNVKERYFKEEKYWLESKLGAELVFCFVWALMNKKYELTFHEECFLQELHPLIKDSRFMPEAVKLMTFIDENEIFIPYKFSTYTCAATDIPEHLNENLRKLPLFDRLVVYSIFSLLGQSENIYHPWRVVTDNYSVPVIEDYLSLYSTTAQQKELLKRIHEAYYTDYPDGNKVDFNVLTDMINLNVYVSDYGNYGRDLEDDVRNDGDEDKEEILADAYNQALEEDAIIKDKQYKQECEALRNQLEQLKKFYENDLESIEAKYQAEIIALKKNLDKKAAAKAKSEETQNVTPQESYITISEIVSDAKVWFHESGASELTNLLYRYIKRHNYQDRDQLWEQIDSIIPAVEKRIAPQQNLSFDSPGQVNINSEVNNNAKERTENKEK